VFDLALSATGLLVDAPGSAGAARSSSRALFIAIIGIRRLRAGAWGELPASLKNGAWQPPAGVPQVRPAQQAQVMGRARWVVAFQRALPVLGLGGLVAWAVATPFRADVPPLPIARAVAEAAADAALRERSVALAPEWRRASVVRLASEEPGPQGTAPARYRRRRMRACRHHAPRRQDVHVGGSRGLLTARGVASRSTATRGAPDRHALPEGRSGAPGRAR
jgi:hypothetical protein